jgi:hypothetical protein
MTTRMPDDAAKKTGRVPARAGILKLGVVAMFAAALLLCGLYAYDTIFSSFGGHDDEGFVLISLREFFQGHALYDQVYSCYQPFLYVFDWLVFRIWGAALCHDSIRLLTIALWLSGAALNAFMAYRVTSNRLLACLVLVVSMNHLSVLANEPGHPLGLSYLLIATIMTLFASINTVPRSPFVVAIGALLGLLLLTKINLGLYVLLPIAFVLAAGTPGLFFKRLQEVLGVAMVALPAILMHSHLAGVADSALRVGVLVLSALVVAAAFTCRSRQSVGRLILLGGIAATAWALYKPSDLYPFRFATLATFSVCSAVLVTRASRPGAGIEPRAWIGGAIGGAGVLAAILATIILRGTSPRGLLDGMVRLPLAQSAIFSLPCRTNVLNGILGLSGLVSLGSYLWGRKALADRPVFHVLVAAAKLLFGGAVLVYCSHLRQFFPFQSRLPDFWMLPFLWLMAGSAEASSMECLTRLAFVAVASLQPMGAYPVAGSQLNVATGLVPVIGAVCVADAIPVLWAQVPNGKLPSRAWRVALAAIVSLCVFITFGREVSRARSRYLAGAPLDLPGASLLRLPSADVHLYQDLVRPLARPDVETFLTLPGLNSLYFWAKKDPPTGFNVTTWMTLLDDRHQERIWDVARRHSGLMTVRNRAMASWWTQGRSIDQYPLVRDIDAEFRTVKLIGDYELMVRR